MEHAAALRLIPNLAVWRPCDGAETLVAWGSAVASLHAPSALLLSRQNLPAQARTPEQTAAIARGGFVLSDHADWPGLLQAIGETDAERVIVTHGQQHFMARWLSEQGLQGEVLQTAFDARDADV